MFNLSSLGLVVTGPIVWHPVHPIVAQALDSDKLEAKAEAGDNNLRAGFINLTPEGDPFDHRFDEGALKVNAMGGDDHISTGSGYDFIYGGSGIDTIDAGDGNNTVYGGSGDDPITSGSGDDHLYGGSGNDTITASFGVDTLSGGSGGDKLFGDFPGFGFGQRDTLNGGSGNDELSGCGGADVLYGGLGADKFVFQVKTDSVANARDTVRDFRHAEGDHIDFSFLTATGNPLDHVPLKFVSSTSTAAHTVWVAPSAAGHETVYVNLDGGAADMSIDVTTSTHLVRGDFFL